MNATFTQMRIARPTGRLAVISAFYEQGIGLPRIGSFENHAGYSGIMFGLPGEAAHLELTEYEAATEYPKPDPDNLLVFYFPDARARDIVAARLYDMGYQATESENPYWNRNGITIEDPDGWHVVLMETPGFRESR